MARLFTYLLLPFLLIGCSSKHPIEIQHDEKNVSVTQKKLNVKFINQTQMKTALFERIKSQLENRGFKLDSSESLTLTVKLLAASEVEKKTSLSEALSHVNINIGYGGYIGNVGIHTQIGTAVDKIFPPKKKPFLHMLVVLEVHNKEKRKETTSYNAYGSLENYSKTELQRMMEEELSKKISEQFK